MNMTVIETSLSTKGYGIPKCGLTHADLVKLRSDLTMSPFEVTNPTSQQQVSFPIYRENSKKIYVPKHFGLSRFGVPTVLGINDGADINLEFSGALRKEQRAPVEAFMAACKDPQRMGGILNLPCAFGKTAIAIYTICALAKKAMVIVHKEFLLEQWIERIRMFAPTARVGVIKGKKVDTADKDIVICLLQSLSMKDYADDLFADFGYVVVDEIHRTGAEVFSRALAKVNFRYAMGLSATLKRKDGLSKVFMYHIGDVVYKVDNRSDTVNVVRWTFDSMDLGYCQPETLGNGKLNMSRMINNVCDFTPRTEFIVGKVHDAMRTDPNRKVLILSDRRTHLTAIGSKLDGSVSWGYYYGGMKQEDLKRSEGCSVILGTFQMSQEGLDIKGLDTLVLASPKSDIVQACGRILRDKPDERRNVPLIIDIVDDFSVFAGQAKKRLAYFERCKYQIDGSNTPTVDEQQHFTFHP